MKPCRNVYTCNARPKNMHKPQAFCIPSFVAVLLTTRLDPGNNFILGDWEPVCQSLSAVVIQAVVVVRLGMIMVEWKECEHCRPISISSSFIHASNFKFALYTSNFMYYLCKTIFYLAACRWCWVFLICDPTSNTFFDYALSIWIFVQWIVLCTFYCGWHRTDWLWVWKICDKSICKVHNETQNF